MSRTIASVTLLFAVMAPLTGWAEPTPAVAFTPAKLDLGYQLVGASSSAVTDRLQNMGTIPLLISGMEAHGDDAGDFAVTSAPPLPATIAPGQTLTIQVTFSPQLPWRPGSRDTSLKFTTSAGIFSLKLTGMGVNCGGPVPASSIGMCADTDGDGFTDVQEENGYIDVNNNGREDDEDFHFPSRRSHIFSAVTQTGAGMGKLFPTVSDPLQDVDSSKVVVKIITGGPVGAATFQYSIDGRPYSGAIIARPVNDIGENLRLLFYQGLDGAGYVPGDSYTFTSKMGERVKIADKNVPNIYVQYDYMSYDVPGMSCGTNDACSAGGLQLNAVCHAGACTHNHAPGDPLFRKVVDQFAAHGITLYIDSVHRAVPHARVVTWSQQGDGSSPPGALAACAGANVIKGNIGPGQLAVNFHDIKNRPGSEFATDPLRKNVYHYTVLSHSNTCLTATPGVDGYCGSCPGDRSPGGLATSPPGSGGTAELPGNDFIVSLGAALDDPFFSTPNDPFIEQGIFMHELGHNLGLHHAGDDGSPIYMPNYLSIMNYNYATTGIQHAAVPGSVVPVESLREVNYSEHALGTLIENSLNENAGVSPLSSGFTGILFFFNGNGAYLPGPEAGPIDWSGNGIIDSNPVSVDLNSIANTSEIMRGYADWVHGACNSPSECPINRIRQTIHKFVDSSVDPHEPCVRNRCQSLWLAFQGTFWGKKD